MPTSSDLAERFAAAFNARDLAALADLLDRDATAEVLDSGLPVERGADMIAKTSLPYLLEFGENDATLTARAWFEAEADCAYVLLLAGDTLDSAVKVLGEGDRIRRLEYVVRPHQPEEAQRIAERSGTAGP